MGALMKYAAKKGEKGWAEKLKGLLGDGAEKVKDGAKKVGKAIKDNPKKSAAIGGGLAGAAAGAAMSDGDEDDKKKKKYPWE